jgi:ATP synthase protein I
MGAGMQFAAFIAICLFLGMWLDRRLGTAPWLLIAGAALGGVGGFWMLYRTLVVAPRERDAAPTDPEKKP